MLLVVEHGNVALVSSADLNVLRLVIIFPWQLELKDNIVAETGKWSIDVGEFIGMDY